MKTLFHLLLASFFLTFLSCSGPDNPAQQTEEQLRDSVFDVHDEVMPRMGELNRISRELKNISGDDEMALDSLTRPRVSEVILQLEKAEEGMMQWMRDFQQPGSMRSTKSHEEIMAYLEQQLQEINKVKQNMNNSMESGKSLLDSLKSQ